MSREIFNLDEVDRFVLGTVGTPGERQFFIQVKKAGQVFSFALEKGQAQALADRFKEIMKDARINQGATMRDVNPLESPIESEFSLGVMAITWQHDTQLIRFEAQGLNNSNGDEVFEDLVSEDVEDAPPLLKLLLTPTQVRTFVLRAISVIKAGRQPCMFCGGPMNLDGHICPRAN